MNHSAGRRHFLATLGLGVGCAQLMRLRAADDTAQPIIDIHQHTRYHGRTDRRLIAHQRAMGITSTILLPAGSPVNQPSTYRGRANGLAANCAGNQEVYELAQKYPQEFLFFANEVPDIAETRNNLEKYLKLGAIGIGEQKFGLEVDCRPMRLIYDIAREFDVPVLMHFQHERYNLGLERFHRILEEYPTVKFIGHAQTWWGNIDKNHEQKSMYPAGNVTAGGLTDQLLKNYSNLFADHSAGSGLNALIRDEDHARGFIARHPDQLLYGSDCADAIGRGPGCQGTQTLKALRRLAPDKAVERKILCENSKKLFKL